MLQPVTEVAEALNAGGMPARIVYGDTYRDASTAYLVPTRGAIPPQVVSSWLGIAKPVNHRAGWVFVSGDEVGVAYNRGIRAILDDPRMGKFKYVLTMEEDNIVPAQAHLLLLQAMHKGGYDAVGGLYWMKGPMAVPMAFGRPGDRTDSGEFDMQPVDMTDAIVRGDVVEVNGLACGCTLWKLDLFRELAEPWFQTMTRIRGEATEIVTQDIAFCRKARAAGKRFAVDARVKVGHLDVATGRVY